MPPRSRGRPPVTAEELARYLFGDPLDPKDVGIIGRLMEQVERNTKVVGRLLGLAWAVLIVFIAAVLTLAGDAVLRLAELHRP
jgi:hypothetical protein